MKLIDALKIVSKKPRLDGKPLNAALVCGFTPLHLQTLLHAELQLYFPDRQVEIKTGLHGDIVGTLSGLRDSRQVFPTLSEEEIQRATPNVVEDWDSLSDVTLIDVIEEEFNTLIAAEDFEHIQSFEATLHYPKNRAPAAR